MELFKTIETRKSIREYTDQPVDKELILKIVNAGRLAATARNIQPWEFIVTTSREQLNKISSMCPNGAFCKNAACLIILVSEDTKYYIEDGSAATQNMLLAIEGLGLGGCWIAGDKKPYDKQIKEMFNIPVEYKLVSMTALGYPKNIPNKKDKRDLSQLIHWDKW